MLEAELVRLLDTEPLVEREKLPLPLLLLLLLGLLLLLLLPVLQELLLGLRLCCPLRLELWLMLLLLP